MKEIRFYVSNEMALNLATLCRRGNLKNDSKPSMPRYKAFDLLSYISNTYPWDHLNIETSRDSKGNPITTRFYKPYRYSYGGRSR
jgi:hypothetical protein